MINDFFTFSPTVTENGSYYIISGVNFKDLENDLRSTYGTTVIASRILNMVSRSRFNIHKFFAVELAWILDDLINKQASSKQRYYRVGINKYRALYEEFKEKTWIKSTLIDYEPYDLKRIYSDFKFKPFPEQKAFLESYRGVKLGYQLRGILLDSRPGTGKAHSLDSNILTPNGFVKMRDIAIGDWVIGRNGKPTKVTGVYPQGEKQLYKVIFADGRSEEVCGEHLWTVKRGTSTYTTNTTELKRYFDNCTDTSDKIYVPLMEDNYDGTESETPLPIDPWLLGKQLSEEKSSIEKVIPDNYLNAPRKVRLALLQGLMDNNGMISVVGTVLFSSPSEVLARQVQYLVRSLGGIAYNTSRKIEEDYIVNYVIIRINDLSKLFRLPGKKEEAVKYKQNTSELALEIISIVPTRIAEAQCISVDAPDHLYIASDFIVTHNTFTSLMWSRMISKGKTIILIPKHLIQDPWVDHLDEKGQRYCFNTQPKYWLSTSNEDPLKSDAEFFIFYTEQMRKDNWKGIAFTKIIDKLSKSGQSPVKMIIDESHNYNDFTSQQTRGMVEFASNTNISDVLFMSGTPLKAQGKETYPMFVVLDKYFDKEVREDFKKLYSRDNYFLNEMLAHRLGRIKFTINSIDGMGEPPKPEIIPISFKGVEKYTLKNIRLEMVHYIQERAMYYQKHLPNYIHDWKGYLNDYEDSISDNKEAIAELTQYRNTVEYFNKFGFNSFTDNDKSKFCKQVEAKIESRLRGEDLKYFRHIVPAIKYLGKKLTGEALGNVLGKARINAIIDMIDNIDLSQIVNSGLKKTAIYSTYIEAINKAYDQLHKAGNKPLKLHSQSQTNIDEVLTKLRTPQYDSLVTSYDTLSEGSPLLMMNQLVLLNAPWREYILKQCIARIFRKGQDSPCFVYLLDLDTGNEENITTRTIDIMSYFKEQVEQLLNGGIGFDTIEGVSTKISENKEYDFNQLIPFDIPLINYRPKFKERSFTSLFR